MNLTGNAMPKARIQIVEVGFNVFGNITWNEQIKEESGEKEGGEFIEWPEATRLRIDYKL